VLYLKNKGLSRIQGDKQVRATFRFGQFPVGFEFKAFQGDKNDIAQLPFGGSKSFPRTP
jgi:limonene-1,2-epoxide hydrolase